MGNSCVTAGCRGSNKGSNVVPSAAKTGLNQGSDVPPPPAGGRSNQVSEEAPSSTLQTTFQWRIAGFSTLLEKGGGWTYSNVFQLRGLNWYLKLNTRDTKSGDQNEYVSLRLQLADDSVTSDKVVETTFKFLILDQLYGKHHEQQVSHNFQSTSTSSGISCMIPLTALKEESSGFLHGNSCVFCVEVITFVIAKANGASETLFIQKMNNTCSDPQVYNWNIEDFFALKSSDKSPEFELCGHKWFIEIYPSGIDKNGNYISLFLNMKVPDTVHQKSAILVEKKLSIKNPETGNYIIGTGRSEYSKSYSWGFGKFVSLEDFKDRYLAKTKCCIEVQVEVIGTSKME